ncbi:MAG: sigma-54 factor interaction domain-containing protein [Dissulfurimicrobium sp.]|uniref:sigma-54 factor interaction domain-containing protein n=1 Tax=Dissulfurimicrobium sp. TaxID=2022436 RepID=UPI00404982E2
MRCSGRGKGSAYKGYCHDPRGVRYGQGLIARVIHQVSPRHECPFIKINCAALPETLLESELFGHEKGAFTGAIARKKGRFELVDSGTLFLDDIGDLPLSLQAKFLRVLQEQQFEFLGGTRTITVDVRLITATNKSLDMAVDNGSFRADPLSPFKRHTNHYSAA